MKNLQILHISNSLFSLLQLLSFLKLLSVLALILLFIFRIKFDIRTWLLIVFTIKRSTCLCLTLDWSKREREKHTVLITKKKLFIVDLQQRCPAISGTSSNHNDKPTTKKTCTSVPLNDWPFYINARHSQRSQPTVTSPRRFTAFNNPQRCCHNGSLSSVPNLLTISANRTPAAAPTATPPSTVPSPSDTTPLSSHRRAQIESRSLASCAIADSSGNSSQKLGK